jgi:hypothetical protein
MIGDDLGRRGQGAGIQGNVRLGLDPCDKYYTIACHKLILTENVKKRSVRLKV